MFLVVKALGIGPGDEVVTSPITFASTVHAILHNGATPVLADIEAETFGVDPEAVRRAMTPRTKAILPVHLYGQTAEMDSLMAIANQRGLAVIEDACQAIGAENVLSVMMPSSYVMPGAMPSGMPPTSSSLRTGAPSPGLLITGGG